MALPNSRRVSSTKQLRIRDMNRISERIRAAGTEYVTDFVMNFEKDGTSLPFLGFENGVLFLRSISNQRENLAKLVDVIATVMMPVYAPSLNSAQSSSKIINAVQRDLIVLVNQIVIYSTPDAVKAAEREIVSVIILAVIDDRIFNQFLQYKPNLCCCILQGSSAAGTPFFFWCNANLLPDM